MRYVCLSIASLFVLVACLTSPALAVLQFCKVFKTEYLDNHPNLEFAAELNKPANRCFVCHQGKNRKHHNAYGIHLVELLDRKTDTKDVAKITAALKTVAAMPVDPSKPDGETFGDLIAAGKWPGGDFESLKQEPPEAEAGAAAEPPTP
ncbi:MAG TPA: hypothetical protein VF982_03745 [Anaerolineales bacterium]